MRNLNEGNTAYYFQQDSLSTKRDSGVGSLHKGSTVKSSAATAKTDLGQENKSSLNDSSAVAPVASNRVLGSEQVIYSNDTLFKLPSVGSLDYTLKSKVFSEDNYSTNLFRDSKPLVSRKESYDFNVFSGRVFVEVADNKSDNVSYAEKPLMTFSFNSWWFFGLIFIISAGLVFFRRYYEKFFGLILLGAVNIREAERFFSSKTSHYSRILGITNALFVGSVCVAIFNYLALVSSTFESTAKSFCIIAAVVLGYLLYRNILLALFSLVSNLREFFSSLSFHHFIYNFIITLFLLLFGLLSTYLPFEFRLFPLYGSLIVVIILLVLRSIRVLHLFILNRFSIFYWILYFCALELVPLAFLLYGFKRLVIIA